MATVGRVSAWRQSSIDAKRSAGVLASARSTASITETGSVGHAALTDGTGSSACRVMIAIAVGPVNGALPASIS